MDIKEAIYTRRSMRRYLNKPVEKALIEQCIDAAVQAPSAMNNQAWGFAIIEDAALMKDISDSTKSYLLGMIDKMPAFEKYRETLSDPEFNVFYGAPALVLICAKRGFGPVVTVDCALAAQNLMLTARSFGLGTCWIGFAGLYLTSPEGRQKLGISDDYDVQAPIIIGYPEGEFGRMDRNPTEVLFWK